MRYMEAAYLFHRGEYNACLQVYHQSECFHQRPLRIVEVLAAKVREYCTTWYTVLAVLRTPRHGRGRVHALRFLQ